MGPIFSHQYNKRPAARVETRSGAFVNLIIEFEITNSIQS
jgi:hypothetical protein